MGKNEVPAHEYFWDISPSLLCIMDFNSVFLSVNPAWQSILGYSPSEMIGRSIYDFVYSEDIQATKNEFMRIISGGGANNFENRYRAKNGTYRWLSWVATTDRQQQVYGIAIEVSDHKKTEEALKESEEKYRRIVETSNEGIWMVDAKSRTLFLNRRMAEMLGYSPQELTDRKAIDFMVGEDRKFLQYQIKRREQGFEDSYDIRFQRKDGSHLWVHANAVPVYGKDGKFASSFAMFTDITEKKRIEAALLESQKQLEDIIDGASNAIFVKDTAGRYITINRKMEELTGKTRKWIKGKTDYEVFSAKQADFYRLNDQQVLSVGHSEQMVEEADMADGRNHIFLVNKFPLYDTQGRPYAVAAIATDITELKQAESALARSKDELEHKVKDRTQELEYLNEQLEQYSRRITKIQEEERKRIAYELHDDTAQYLSILKLQLDSLIHSGKIRDPGIVQKLEFLERDAGRAVNDVRRYSHELRPVVLEHLGLRAALEQIAEDINKLKLIKIEVETEGVEPQLSEEIKLGFFRIAQEALSNSRKHSRANRAYVFLRFLNHRIEMTVSDDGIGFDVQSSANWSRLKGSLGLLSMQERAKLIGANLKIESRPGHGTTIIATLAI